MIFGLFTLFVALVISAVAAYYSIVGLTAIFSAAVIPIIIMGASLEVGKITAAVWLKLNWHRAKIVYKLYLIPAVAFLMLLTSMGIFGFLSKAHSDQNLVSGDIQAKLAIYDEKIKTAKDNIEADRRQLKQMDEAVDQVMGRSTTEEGATKANNIRRSQQRERSALAKDIEAQQKLIASINDEAAPIRAEVRKVEAEVGPVKYIAALIYGDNPDANILERAVRWVIIIIVAVFDPLALVLILAAQQSLRWARDDQDKEKDDPLPIYTYENFEKPTEEELAEIEAVKEHSEEQAIESELGPQQPEESLLEKYPYLTKPFTHFKNTKPMVYKPEEPKPVETDLSVYDDERLVSTFDKVSLQEEKPEGVDPAPVGWMYPAQEVKTEAAPEEKEENVPYVPATKPVVIVPEAMERPPKEIVQVEETKDLRQSKNGLTADNDANVAKEVKAHFGTEFPGDPDKGEMFLRVDYLPSRLYKYNGSTWIEVDKKLTDTYVYNDEYIKYLILEIEAKRVDPEDLSDSERDQIEEFLRNGQ